MKKFRKITLFVLLISVFLGSLTGCSGNTVAIFKPDVLFDESTTGTGTGEFDKARLFLDNTYGMYGYVLSGTNEKSGYCTMLSCLKDFMNKYATKSFYCMQDKKEENETKWVLKEEDRFNYKAKAFYKVYNPLKNPYLIESIDFTKGLNIYVTDFAEGAASNKEFAALVNKNIISGENRSALLYCFLVKYSGLSSVDNANVIKDETGEVSQEHKKVTIEKKPLYMIVSGSTVEIQAFYSGFGKALADEGFDLEDDYYCEKFMSGRGLNEGEAEFRTNDFEVSRETLEIDPLSKEYTYYNTDMNFDMELTVPNKVFADLHEDLPGLFIEATNEQIASVSGEDQYLRRFSFILDLPKTEVDSEDISYTFNIDSVYYASESTADIVATDAGSETDEEATQEELGYVVENIVPMSDDEIFDLLAADNKLRKMNVDFERFDDCATIEKSLISEDVFNDLSEKTKSKIDNKRLFNIKAMEDGTSYFVSLSLKNGKELQEKYDMLIISVSVEGNVAVEEDIPDWVLKYDAATAKKNGRYNANTCAEDLKYIYDYLNGTMSNTELQQEYSDYMSTTVCSFPIVIDFRAAKDIDRA